MKIKYDKKNTALLDSEQNVHVPSKLLPYLKQLDEAKNKDEKILAFIDGLIWFEEDSYQTLKNHTGLASLSEIHEHKIALLYGIKKGITAENFPQKNLSQIKFDVSQSESKMTEQESIDYFNSIKSGEYSRMSNQKVKK